MSFKDVVYKQKHLLRKKLEKKLTECTIEITNTSDPKDRELDGQLIEPILTEFALENNISGRIYALNKDRIQITSDIYKNGKNDNFLDKELNKKLFVSEERKNFYISNTYISHTTLRPTVSAVKMIISKNSIMGYLVMDIVVRNIGGEDSNLDKKFLQLKGDPVIRENIFNSIRKQSEMDNKIDDVHSIANELVQNLGIFHIKLHYSSSRATVWSYQNPFEYVVHTIEEILTPDVCLLYRERDYPTKATLDPALIPRILEKFKYLRFMDDNIYLRAGSINIINSKVGLNFSCDGSHYLDAVDFLERAESEYGID